MCLWTHHTEVEGFDPQNHHLSGELQAPSWQCDITLQRPTSCLCVKLPVGIPYLRFRQRPVLRKSADLFSIVPTRFHSNPHNAVSLSKQVGQTQENSHTDICVRGNKHHKFRHAWSPMHCYHGNGQQQPPFDCVNKASSTPVREEKKVWSSPVKRVGVQAVNGGGGHSD